MKINQFSGGMPFTRIPPQLVRIMKITAIIMTVFLLQVSPITSAQVTLQVKQESMSVVLKSISNQTGYYFVYSVQDIETAKPVTLRIENVPITKALNLCFEGQPFSFEVKDKTVLIKKKENNLFEKVVARFQEINVSGKVMDESGNPLPGANIKVKGNGIATTTNGNGEFTLKGIPENAILEISYLGYIRQEVPAKEQLNITLQPASSELEEVTISKGYYSTTKTLNTGSVSSVKGEIIAAQPVSNPLMALEGRVPGLYIAQTSGVPGSEIRVRLRGTNSIANGNDPLYIIDGIPVHTERDSRNFGAAGPISPLALIAPNDIESVDVLKDADATSIYGSRGANGVILITTKRGKSGKTAMNVNVSQGISKVASRLKLTNTQQYLEIRRQAFLNDGLQPGPTDYDLNGTWDQNRYTDWQEVFIGGTAPTTNAQATLSGGNEQTQFLASTEYRKEKTVYPGDHSTDRFSGRINVTHKSINKKLEVAFNSSLLNYDSNLPVLDVTQYILLAPNAPAIYDSEGKLNWENSTWNNPFSALERRSRTVSQSFRTNADVRYQILKNFTFKTNLSYNSISDEDKNIYPFSSFDPITSAPETRRSMAFGFSQRKSWIAEPLLSYSNRIDDHFIEVMIGTSFYQSQYSLTRQVASGYSSDEQIENLAAATTISQNFNSDILYKYNAIYGRIGYHFKEKYSLNFTGRRDGSSRFGPGRQFGNFGAIGAAWIFSNEAFLKDVIQFLNYGKLRSSIGITGNDQLLDYEFLDTYTANSFAYLGVGALRPTQLTNPYYGWETIKKVEVGLELGFLDSKISLNASWFRNRTGNQLVGYPLPAITGFSNIRANLPAIVQNTGLEFDLSSKNLNEGSFHWTTNFNLTVPKNKLVSYPNFEASTYTTQYAVGFPLTVSYVYNFTGINPETGLYTFQDINNDGAISSTRDRLPVFVGQRFFGGISNTFSWKGLQLDVFFQFVKQTGFAYTQNGLPGYFTEGPNQPLTLYNKWKESPVPFNMLTTRFATANTLNTYYQNSDDRITDASFIRVKNVSLNYNLPKVGNIFQSAKFYLQGQNLATFSKYKGVDPENLSSGASSPPRLAPLRTMVIGLQVSL